METWSFSTLLICFGGGIVGAAFGDCGQSFLLVLSSLRVLDCDCRRIGFYFASGGSRPYFGPQAGGFVAGAARSAIQWVLRRIIRVVRLKTSSPLVGTSWDVMAVGGIFAVFGWALQHVLLLIPIVNQFDCIALTVALASLLARYMFLKEMPLGKPESIKQYGLLGTNNYAISWCGWQSPPQTIAVLGLGASIMSVAMAYGLKQCSILWLQKVLYRVLVFS